MSRQIFLFGVLGFEVKGYLQSMPALSISSANLSCLSFCPVVSFIASGIELTSGGLFWYRRVERGSKDPGPELGGKSGRGSGLDSGIDISLLSSFIIPLSSEKGDMIFCNAFRSPTQVPDVMMLVRGQFFHVSHFWHDNCISYRTKYACP